jgi:hypothetical protein
MAVNTRGRISGAALALALGLAPVAFGQDPEPKDVRKIYTPKTEFKLPVQIDDKERADLTGLKLFVKAVPGAWECKDSAPADQKLFFFRAPHDGEYWFSFATVDKAGAVTPANPDRVPPGLIVVVDTRPPEISLHPLPTPSGPNYLQCKLIDANPDYDSIKVEYATATKSGMDWHPLEPVADTPGVFQVPDKSVLSARVRVHAADRAGNVTDREIDLARGSAPIQQTAADPVTLPKPVAQPPLIPDLVVADKPAPALMPPDVAAPMPIQPVTADTPKPAPHPLPAAFTAPDKDVMAINSLRCNIAISVEAPLKADANVEVWASPDSGKSWLLVGQSRDATNAVRAEFPREGLYGYTFVVKSSSNAGQPPAAGDTPDGWIEVDTTKPVAELLSVSLGTENDAGHLLITWVAQDRNFGPEPIALSYASQPTGPWQPLAEKLANTGRHRWPLPRNLGGRVYVRLTAIDRAGNATVCDCPTPVQLETTRPKVKVLSVTPDAKE